MLTLLQGKKEKEDAQKRFSRLIGSAWGESERRTVSWRPNAMELDVFHNGDYWFFSETIRDSGIPHYWNIFGIYEKNGRLHITVEINIAIEGNDRRVSGFFARDERTGIVYLMHDGDVGGGRRGISRSFFCHGLEAGLFLCANAGGRIGWEFALLLSLKKRWRAV